MTLKRFLIFAAISLLAATGVRAEVLRMAVTTSFANSGLADVILPEIEADTGITVQLLIVGTGQALALGAAGDVDAVLVHARSAEEAWLGQGNGTHRREIMYNDFVVVGPSDDPAGVAATHSATDALTAIAAAKAPFVSRGDESGTHKKEKSLWKAAGIAPQGNWYRAVGQGMGAALNTASGMNAYILSDRASWLNFGNKGDLALLYAGDPALFNQYAYLPVNPVKYPHVNASGAEPAGGVADRSKGARADRRLPAARRTVVHLQRRRRQIDRDACLLDFPGARVHAAQTLPRPVSVNAPIHFDATRSGRIPAAQTTDRSPIFPAGPFADRHAPPAPRRAHSRPPGRSHACAGKSRF